MINILIIIILIINIYIILGFKQIKKKYNNNNNTKIDNVESISESKTKEIINSSKQDNLISKDEIEELINNKINKKISIVPGEKGKSNIKINHIYSSDELGYEVSGDGDEVNVLKDLYLDQNLNIPAWENMIVPFWIDFTQENIISDMKLKFWYLCDGSTCQIPGRGSVTSPNLTGRFIRGGSIKNGNSITHGWDNNIKKFNKYHGLNYNKLTVNQLPSHKHNHTHVVENNINGWDNHYGNGHQGSIQNRSGRWPSDYEAWINYKIVLQGRNQKTKHDGGYTGNGHSVNNIPPSLTLGYFIYLPDKRI